MISEPDLFAGFEATRISSGHGSIFARIAGKGAPLLLLHGYPQTHICWHKVAPALAEKYRVVVADLPGYGASDCPRPDTEHIAYSKRAMAQALVEAMAELGHRRFCVIGHDRGARVAYRMALDHAEAVERLGVLDILTTYDVWEEMRWQSAIKAYHWPFLAQPHPLPETLIAADPAYYVEATIASWAQSRDLSPFDPAALDCYRRALIGNANIRAVCEDYRAGATIDYRLDADALAREEKITCPTLALWGTDYVGTGGLDPLSAWRKWCRDVRGTAIDAGHFLAEENPEAVLAELLPFLAEMKSASSDG